MHHAEPQAASAEAQYVTSAIAHRALLETGDVVGSNAAHDKLIEAIREIRGRADRGRSFLLDKLDHADENVRLWSASHLLPLDERTALAELRQLTRNAKSSTVRSSADMTEEQWLKGDLDIDWFMTS